MGDKWDIGNSPADSVEVGLPSCIWQYVHDQRIANSTLTHCGLL